jgi:Skp family chaperone for outer membrane proteins
MNRLITSVLFAALWLPLIGMAQTSTPAPAAAGPFKVVWVDLDYAIFNCDQGKKEFDGLQKFMEAKKTEMDALKKEVDTLQNTITVQRDKIKEDALEEMEAQYESKNTQLTRFQQDAQKDLDSRKNRIGNAIGKKMMEVIGKYAKEKGLSSVVLVNQTRDAYVDPSLVATEEIIKAFNQAYPVAASKAPESAPAKK